MMILRVSEAQLRPHAQQSLKEHSLFSVCGYPNTWPWFPLGKDSGNASHVYYRGVAGHFLLGPNLFFGPWILGLRTSFFPETE